MVDEFVNDFKNILKLHSRNRSKVHVWVYDPREKGSVAEEVSLMKWAPTPRLLGPEAEARDRIIVGRIK